MAGRPLNALFLCTGNSARSILAEAILNDRGRGRFQAFSAGSHPKDEVHPLALELLEKHRFPTGELRSKSWEEFARPGAPQMDFVITVCDNAADEVCPVWPGHPMTAHWGIPDPAAVAGAIEARRRAFNDAYAQLGTRLSFLLSLPIEKLDRLTLKRRLDEIGTTGRETQAR